jgi:hypothetical protein
MLNVGVQTGTGETKSVKNGRKAQQSTHITMSGSARREVGAASPRALAELRAGRPIDWSIENEAKMLEQLLDLPANKLYDPKFGSPIYSGVPLDFSHTRCRTEVSAKTDVRKLFDETPKSRVLLEHGLVSDSVLQRPTTNLRLFSAEIADRVTQQLQSMDDPREHSGSPREAARYTELAVANRLADLSDAKVVEPGRPLGMLDRKFVILWPEWLKLIFSDLSFGNPGEYFINAPTAISPVQGALGDCWLIAAMSSVSWTMPELFGERIRREAAAGDVDAAKVDFLFDLTDVLTIALPFLNITIPYTFKNWIGPEVPQYDGGGYIYARSSVAGETWPAVVEKAVAVWRSGGSPDYPFSNDYGHLNGGDPAWACHVLTGGTAWYHWADADTSWSTIQSYCTGNRTHSPLVAWTWGSQDDSPKKVDYAGANLVANHAYSILGTWETNKRQYVVLRNPWGYAEGTLNIHAGAWSTSESWGSTALTLPGDGVFALEIHTFRDYFMGFGGAN